MRENRCAPVDINLVVGEVRVVSSDVPIHSACLTDRSRARERSRGVVVESCQSAQVRALVDVFHPRGGVLLGKRNELDDLNQGGLGECVFEPSDPVDHGMDASAGCSFLPIDPRLTKGQSTRRPTGSEEQGTRADATCLGKKHARPRGPCRRNNPGGLLDGECHAEF